MAKTEEQYPVNIKTNSKLKIGYYWPIVLSDGSISLGIILDLPKEKYTGSTVMFIAGLLDWNNTRLPTVEELKKCKVIKAGNASIKIIEQNGQIITGFIDLDNTEIKMPLMVDTGIYNKTTYIVNGYTKVRLVKENEFSDYECLSTWGLNVINILAEKLLKKSG